MQADVLHELLHALTAGAGLPATGDVLEVRPADDLPHVRHPHATARARRGRYSNMVWRVTRNELLQQLAEHLMQLEHHSSRPDLRRNASRGRTRAPPGRPAA
eukprot:522136-Prorocentrum_lima.AAC.1